MPPLIYGTPRKFLICEIVQNGEAPLPQCVSLHPDAPPASTRGA